MFGVLTPKVFVLEINDFFGFLQVYADGRGLKPLWPCLLFKIKTIFH